MRYKCDKIDSEFVYWKNEIVGLGNMRGEDMLENRGVGEIKRLCGRNGISPIELSMHIGVIPVRIYEILNGKRRITIDTDLRLCKFFELENRHFFDMQADYDYELMEEKLSDKLERIKTIRETAKGRKK